jgi:hypothetical protein
MMGRQTGDQSRLFYSFNLEERIPGRHPLRQLKEARMAEGGLLAR